MKMMTLRDYTKKYLEKMNNKEELNNWIENLVIFEKRGEDIKGERLIEYYYPALDASLSLPNLIGYLQFEGNENGKNLMVFEREENEKNKPIHRVNVTVFIGRKNKNKKPIITINGEL